MIAETFNIKIDGYWKDVNKAGIPNHSGVYFVYECTCNEEDKIVKTHKLIYIGESDKVRDRIANHEKYNDFEKHVRPGNTLCYSTGPVSDTYRERVEAAYIYKHKPPENEEYTDSFPFNQTTVNSSGNTALLYPSFTVKKLNIIY